MSWKNIILSLLHLSTESRPFLVLIKLYQPVVFFSIMGAETFAIIFFFFASDFRYCCFSEVLHGEM